MVSKEDLINQYKQLSFYSQNCNNFIPSVSDKVISASDQVGLIYIAPESFLMGITREILVFLEEKGYVFLEVNVIDKLTEEQIGRLIALELEPSFRWWLIERRFTLGPIAALLVCKKEKSSEFLKDLKKLKGYKFPLKADETSLRSKLPAINGLFNLMHASDDTAAVLRDSDYFFNVQQIEEAIKKSIQVQNGQKVGLSINEIVNKYFLGYQGDRKTVTFFELYFKLVYRIHARIKLFSGEFISSELQELIAQGIKVSTSGISRWEEREKILPIFYEMKKIIKSTDSEYLNSNAIGLLNIFRDLVVLDGSLNKDWLAFLNKLEGYGIGIEYFHKLVIASTLFFINDEYPELVNKM